MSTQLPDKMEAFVAQELADFARYLEQTLRERVAARNIVEDGGLLRSIAANAAQKEVRLMFQTQGRFHDMGAGRGYRKGQYVGDDPTRPHPGHKPSKWYSRAAWGATYGTLVNNLMNKYVAEVAADMKQSLSHGNTAN